MLKRWFGGADADKAALRPLYDAVVAVARRPAWYRDGGLPDTLDGRFDMIALVLSLVLLRLEAEGDGGRAPSAYLAELFVDDMDPQLRQMGIGDLVVGKHVGRMMGALGGRLTAYRLALAGDAPLEDALIRNLWRGAEPDAAPLAWTAAAVTRLHAAIAEAPLSALLQGRFADAA